MQMYKQQEALSRRGAALGQTPGTVGRMAQAMTRQPESSMPTGTVSYGKAPSAPQEGPNEAQMLAMLDQAMGR